MCYRPSRGGMKCARGNANKRSKTGAPNKATVTVSCVAYIYGNDGSGKGGYGTKQKKRSQCAAQRCRYFRNGLRNNDEAIMVSNTSRAAFVFPCSVIFGAMLLPFSSALSLAAVSLPPFYGARRNHSRRKAGRHRQAGKSADPDRRRTGVRHCLYRFRHRRPKPWSRRW